MAPSSRREELTILAETSLYEGERVEFKQCFLPEQKAAFWAEIVKDIVAIANTNGGVIIFGLDDQGQCSGHDVSALESFDSAKVTDQINKYTNIQFADFFILSAVRSDGVFPAIAIYPTRLPIVFTKVGTYSVGKNVQKTAFSVGTLYFRHGAKSEPANQDDVRDAYYRELERVRKDWLGNIRQVMEADPGSKIIVDSPAEPLSNLRLSDDPTAPAVRVKELSETHPYRQTEAISQIRKRATRKIKLNSHDIQCIKFSEGVNPNTRPDLIHKPHAQASPQYSEAFVELVCDQVAANQNYFLDCRAEYKAARYGSGDSAD